MRIQQLLKNNPDVYQYYIRTNTVESFELYFSLDTLETMRKTEDVDTTITIFTLNDGNTLGEATFSYHPSESKMAFNKKLEMAILQAKAMNNEFFELPKDEKASKKMNTNIDDNNKIQIGRKIYDIIKDEINKTNAKINALEIFIKTGLRTIENSLNLKKKYRYADVFIEAIPTFDTKEMSYELYQAIHLSSFDEEEIRKDIKKYLNDVENRSKAYTPKEKIDVPVVINAEELSQIFNEYASLCNYQALYTHSNMFNIGDDIIEDVKGDKITLSAVAKIKGSIYSSFFDRDGVSLNDTTLIDKNIMTNFYGNHRYAYYLKEKETGMLPCIKVAKGSFNEETLKKLPHLEALSFSGLQIDPFSDYLGGEVRLAKYFDGQETKYLTGISISAKLSDVFKDIKLSKNTRVVENYIGPSKALVKMEIL